VTKVKICGLRRTEDAEIVNAGLPDFIGFILTPSKRRVTIGEAAEISRYIVPSILRVGVFAAERPEVIAEASQMLSLDGIQLHMDTTEAFVGDLVSRLRISSSGKKPFLWQRLPVPPSASGGEDIAKCIRSFPDLSRFDGLLLDTRRDGQDGGSGKTFPWEPARDFLREADISASRVIVAGGLDEGNVTDAISFFQPFAVDVSSGVESGGYKDSQKVFQFIERVRGFTCT